MYRLNGKRNLIVVGTYDDCNYKELSTVIPTYSATRRTIRELMKMGWKFENLAVKDVETGRLISWMQ